MSIRILIQVNRSGGAMVSLWKIHALSPIRSDKTLWNWYAAISAKHTVNRKPIFEAKNCYLYFFYMKWSEQCILYTRTIFYNSRAIKKSSKQRHIIVCFSVLSISSAYSYIFCFHFKDWRKKWIIHIASSVMLQNAENVMSKLNIF
jgi:hypothetical protein